MDIPQKHPRLKKPNSKDHVFYDSHLYEMLRKSKSTEIEKQTIGWIPRTGDGNESCLKTDSRDLFGVMEMF